MKSSKKVTLSFGQLKRLIKESLIAEYEEVLVKTPSGDELGVLDDEGNFQPGGYPRANHDAGEIIDDTGEYARMCGMYSKEYGYDLSKKPASSNRRPSSVFLYVEKQPKDEELARLAKAYIKAFKEKKDTWGTKDGKPIYDAEKTRIWKDALDAFKERIRTKDPFFNAIPDGKWELWRSVNEDGTILFFIAEIKTEKVRSIDMYGRMGKHVDSRFTAKHVANDWHNTSEDGV